MSSKIKISELLSQRLYDGDVLDGSEGLPLHENDEGKTKGITISQLFSGAVSTHVHGTFEHTPDSDEAGAAVFNRADGTTVLGIDTSIPQINANFPLNMGSRKITGLADPTNPQDAATVSSGDKRYYIEGTADQLFVNRMTGDTIEGPIQIQQPSGVPDNGDLNSEDLDFVGRYDGDSSSTINESRRVITLRQITEYASAAGEYRLGVLDDAENEFATFEGDTQNFGLGVTGPLFLAHLAGGNYAHLGAPASGPTTTDMDNGSVIFHLDETNDDLNVTAKKSDGTVLTGTVTLS